MGSTQLELFESAFKFDDDKLVEANLVYLDDFEIPCLEIRGLECTKERCESYAQPYERGKVTFLFGCSVISEGSTMLFNLLTYRSQIRNQFKM